MSGWDQFQDAPAAPQGMPAPLIDLRDPTKARDLEIKEEGLSRDGRKETRDVGNDAFTQTSGLRQEFENKPNVKAYKIAIPAYTAALNTAPNPQGDISLIYSYAKLMDPESVVRESEADMVANSDTVSGKIYQRLSKEFTGDGTFGQGVRDRLRAEMQNRMKFWNSGYNSERATYERLAQQYNFDPKLITDEHFGTRFLPEIQKYWGSRGESTGSQARDPNMVGGIAEGTNVTFAGDDGTGFDRNKWLMETAGFDPNGEANLVAWISANSGNPNLTKEDVQAAYQRFSEGRSTGAVDDEFMEKMRNGKGAFQGFDSSFAENLLKIKSEQLAIERDTAGGAADAFMRGAAQVPSFGLADKLTAATNTIFDGGTYAENMDQQRLINTADDISNPYASMAGELTGAVLLPYGAGARSPMELAKVAAVTSGATEFNQSSAPFVDRLLPTALATGTGGALGYGTGAAVEKLAPVVGRFADRLRGNAASNIADDMPAEMSAPDFIAAAQRRNVDYLPADIPGSNTLQIATALTDNTLGSPMIQRGAEKAVASVKGAVRRETDALGGAPDNTGAGQAVQKGVNAWQDSADAKIGDLYEKIPVAADAAGDTTNTLAALRDVNNPLSSNAALSAQISDPKLKAYQEALEGGGLSWQDLKGFRTYLGQKLGAPSLQSDIPKDRLRAIYAGLSADMESTAMKQGPEALSAFKRANTYKRAVETRRENVMGLLLGKNLDMSPEKTFAQIQSWGKKSGGDFAKLSQAIRSLPEAEANAVRATIIDGLGRATDGAQNANGTVFSPNTFATQWNKLSPRAKAVLFQGEHRAALDDIAGISYAMKAADKYNNTSRTGLTVGAGGTLLAAGADVVTGGLALLGQAGMGAVLGSPRLAKWVAALYKKPNAKAVDAHIARLDNLAKAEPVIANEIFQLQTRLRDAFGQGQMQLAANPGEEKGTPLPTAKTTTAGEPQ